MKKNIYIFFRSQLDCEQSLIFLCKVTTRETQAIPYCDITSWFAIALAEIRTRRNLRKRRSASNLDFSCTSCTQRRNCARTLRPWFFVERLLGYIDNVLLPLSVV